MLKIGVLGAGHLGKIHLACLQSLSDTYEVVGFHDPNPDRTREAVERFQIPAFESVSALLDAVQVVDIVTPTVNHYECAVAALERGLHVFIEKPVTHTVEEGKRLCDKAIQSNVSVQVGHVERFNPAWNAVEPHVHSPRFIEAHRLSTFHARGTDIPVVLDLMIHDIDVILTMVQSDVCDVRASGATVLSPTPDIANARIEFADGCVANLTASRVSMHKMRKMRIFQPNSYITLDFLDKKASKISFGSGIAETGWNVELNDGSHKHMQLEPFVVVPNNAIQEELAAFAQCIHSQRVPLVPIEDGLRALELAHRIMACI